VRFRRDLPGKGAASEWVRTWEVAVVSSMGPDDSREDWDETRTEDAGLPEHEDDDRRAEDTGTGEQNP
jgi:hypothetical protein